MRHSKLGRLRLQRRQHGAVARQHGPHYGRYLYTSERNSNTLAMWAVDGASCELKLIGHQPTEKQPRGFQIDPSGSWLLAVGQLSHAMTAYRIDPASGRLAPQASLPLGKNPNWVEIIDLP